MDVYKQCPVLANDQFTVKLIEENDVDDLLSVYSDKLALPFFNSDGCNGSNFYCAIREHMAGAVKYWLVEYENKNFVRFSIIDNADQKAIGTIEMFRRESAASHNGCGILRLDVRSDYEQTDQLKSILSLIVNPFYDWFGCTEIVTKGALYAVDRIEALKQTGFTKSSEPLIGHDGIAYYDYWHTSKGVQEAF